MRIRKMIPRLLGTSVLLAVLLSACSDEFFTKSAGDRITPGQHYNNINDGFFVSWPGAIVNLQEAMPRFMLLNSLRSDQLEATINADQYLREIDRNEFSEFNPYTGTDAFYKVIVNLNENLVYLDTLASRERELDDYTTFVIRGELIAFRAWVYFQVARLNGSVIYHPDNMETLPDDAIEPMSKDVLLDTLINQMLPYIYDNNESQENIEFGLDYYVNPKGILGQLYLEKGDYANAAYYLKLACESYPLTAGSGAFKVDNTYRNEAWFSIFLNSESAFTENFAVIPFVTSENQVNPLPRWLGYDFDYVAAPTQIMIDSFLNQIPASGAPGDQYRGLGITFGVDTISKTSETEFETENYVMKFEMDQGDPFSTDLILQRAADIHLLLAEAYANLGDEDSEFYALMLLNLGVNDEVPKPPEFIKWSRNRGIRGRVNLAPKEIPENLTGQDRIHYLEDLIMDERALECALEGHRFFDLMRVAERRGDPAYLADRVAAKFEGTPYYDEVWNRLMNPDNWYVPAK